MKWDQIWQVIEIAVLIDTPVSVSWTNLTKTCIPPDVDVLFNFQNKKLSFSLSMLYVSGAIQYYNQYRQWI